MVKADRKEFMKLKIMLAVLLTVGSVTTVSAETIGSAGYSAKVNELLNQSKSNEITVSRSLTEKFNEINEAVKDADVDIDKNDVVVVTSSMEEITENTDNGTDKETDTDSNKTSDLKVVKTDVEEVSKSVYAKQKVNVRELPTEDSDKIDTLEKGKKIEVTGKVGKWYRIQYKEGDAFLSSELCTENNPNEVKETKDSTDNSADTNTNWNGKKLTKSAGVVNGPSGKETYYNLNMSGVVRRLKSMGYSGDYWVRDDGVKMFGNYILVAASFDIRPIGTILPTSLGIGIVADTGGFARHNKYQLDIATNW